MSVQPSNKLSSLNTPFVRSPANILGLLSSYRNGLTLLVLLALTTISAMLGELTPTSSDYAPLILVILVVKAQLIIDYFMQLKSSKPFWRYSMSAFALVIALIIWICN